MPKLNVYVSERLAEAVRRYEVSPSPICQEALTAEVAKHLPILDLTPRARDLLRTAKMDARELGHDYVGVEHLLFAILAEKHGIAAEVVDLLGVREDLHRGLREALRRPSEPSNRILDNAGNVIAYLLVNADGEHDVVSPDGDAVTLRRDRDRGIVAVDQDGNDLPGVPASAAPLFVDGAS